MLPAARKSLRLADLKTVGRHAQSPAAHAIDDKVSM